MAAVDTFLFTSESVNEGHPDKLCDQVSDAVLDACLAEDPDSKVAWETCTKTNMVMVFGEITTEANVDYEKIVRETCRNIGFVSADVGLDADHCKVLVNIEQQSPDIAQGVHGHFTKRPEGIGAGDQGHMFGYATDETPELMPLSHVLATKLGARLTEVRKSGTCPWLRPDGKTQVTVEYRNEGGAMVPIRVHTVLISTQHDGTVTNDEIAADLKEHVIKPVIPEQYLDEKTIFHLNPSGRFVIGGPHGDAGLTGRKIIIDTYGGWGAHGGGIIKQIRQESGALIKVASSNSDPDDDCIITVSAKEFFEDPVSPTIDAAVRLQPRCSEKSDSESAEQSYTTRLLVSTSRIGCLIGKGGSIITEIRRTSRANIRILSKENVPKVAAEDEEMVQISGGLDVARHALVQIATRLKANFFEREGSLSAFPSVIPCHPLPSGASDESKYLSRDTKPVGHYLYSSAFRTSDDMIPSDSYASYGGSQALGGGYGAYSGYSARSSSSGLSGHVKTSKPSS